MKAVEWFMCLALIYGLGKVWSSEIGLFRDDFNALFLKVDEDSMDEFLGLYKNLSQLIPRNESEIPVMIVVHSAVIMNQTLDMNPLANLSQKTMTISFIGVQGFVVSKQSSPFFAFTASGDRAVTLELNSPIFNFYNSRLEVIDSCEDHLKAFYGLNELDRSKNNITELIHGYRGPFSIQTDSFELVEVSFRREVKLCPLIFNRASIVFMDIGGFEADFIHTYRLEFESLVGLTEGREVDLDINLKYVNLKAIYRVAIDEQVLSTHVFKNIRKIGFTGLLLGFKNEDMFKPFKHLRHIILRLYDIKEFFHSADNNWFKGVNQDVRMDPTGWLSVNQTVVQTLRNKSVLIEIQNDGDYSYNYPDEDICLFKHFDHWQALLSIVTNGYMEFNTSCTLLHLISYSYDINLHEFSFQYGYDAYIYDRPEYSELRKACALEERLARCWLENSTKLAQVSTGFYYDDLRYSLSILQFVGPIVTFPIVSALGFVLNLLITLIITSKRNQKEIFKGERIFKYMRINAVFNMIECLLSVTILAHECLGPNSIYCPSFFNSNFVVYFGIYVAGYVGECMKTCSILTGLVFSFERYLITLNSKSPIWKRFRQIKMRYLMSLVVAVSMLTCANQFFEMKAFRRDDYDFSPESITFNTMLFRVLWFRVLHGFHYVLNDFVLLTVNMIIDILLVRLIRKDLRMKANFSLNASATKPDHMKKTLEEIKKAEENTNQMIIFLFLTYLFCRIPEIIFSTIPFIGYVQINTTVYKTCPMFLCPLLNNIVQYVYMFSYLTNIFFYYKFNKPFRHGFRAFFARKKEYFSSAKLARKELI